MIIFSDDARAILEKRYLLKDVNGKCIETPENMLTRVARTAASVEREKGLWEERFYSLMANKRFLPNSPTLANAGREKGQLAACFVLPVYDSIEGIFETLKKAALIHKTGGGTGFSFSALRPKNDIVASTGGLSSGPVPFIKAFDCATDAVKQGGMRKGANMAVLDYWHPDILDFVQIKREEGKLANFNISVGVDRNFMSQLLCNGYIEFVNPRTNTPTGERFSTSEMFNLMAQGAWENGEPGILFFDHINRGNTVPGYSTLKATNPCGEQPLFDHESCNLGSLNLSSYVYSNGINYELMGEDIKTAVRFLDNIIDINYYTIPEIEAVTKSNRKIGLGVMGFADLLIDLEIPYASHEALQLIDKLMGFIKKKALEASSELGTEKGNFPNIEKSIYKGRDMRNATVTTIAPTGTISMLLDISSGIEPLFGLVFIKEALNRRSFRVVNRRFEEAARRHGVWSQELSDELISKGGIGNIRGIPEQLKRVFATAFEIPAEWHVRVQAQFQKYVDNAVSKTVNVPNDVSVEEVKRIFILAWEMGCKGLTIYRTGSRKNQVLRLGDCIKQSQEGTCTVCAE